MSEESNMEIWWMNRWSDYNNNKKGEWMRIKKVMALCVGEDVTKNVKNESSNATCEGRKVSENE